MVGSDKGGGERGRKDELTAIVGWLESMQVGEGIPKPVDLWRARVWGRTILEVEWQEALVLFGDELVCRGGVLPLRDVRERFEPVARDWNDATGKTRIAVSRYRRERRGDGGGGDDRSLAVEAGNERAGIRRIRG